MALIANTIKSVCRVVLLLILLSMMIPDHIIFSLNVVNTAILGVIC